MKDYSQNGETKIIADLFEKIGMVNKFCVEFGAGDGFHLSNCAGLKEIGWTGLMMDADNKGNNEVKKEFITRENILRLFDTYKVPYDLGLLSIDIDGNDYHILKRILNLYTPAVIICEVNSEIPIMKEIVMPYDANHIWDGTNAFGMSYFACFKLLNQGNYKVYDIVNNTNVIAVNKRISVESKQFTIGATKSHPHREIYWQEI